MKLCFLILLNFFALSLYAQTKNTDSLKGTNAIEGNHTKTSTGTKDTNMNTKTNDKTDSKSQAKNEKSEETPIKDPADTFTNGTKLIAVIGLLVIMAWALVQIFNYVNISKVFIGHNTIKLIGFVLLLPSICIISLISSNTISGPVLATLLGTIAGYVLSRNQENDNEGFKHNAPTAGSKPGIVNDVDSLKHEINELKKENEALKAKNSTT